MTNQQTGRWMAWSTLLAVVVVAICFFMWFRMPQQSPKPATRVVTGSDWPRTLVEQFPDGHEGRRITIPSPPQRIVSLTLATDEILIDLVEPNRIAALSYLANSPQSNIADRIASIRHFEGNDVESILALEPDLCFLAQYNREAMRSLLAEAGVPVFVFRRFDSLDDIRQNIVTVGQAVGADKKAAELIDRMDAALADVTAKRPPQAQWPSALVYGQTGWVAGAGTLQSQVLESAGLRNAAAEAQLTGFVKVSEEQVLSMTPDYLVILEQSIDLGGQKEWLLNNPALAPLEAVQQQRFLTIKEGHFLSVSHYVVNAVAELARQTYPGRFSND